MSGFVCGLVVFDCFVAIFLSRNTACDLLFCSHLANFVAIESAISDQSFGLGQVFEQNICAFEATKFAFRQILGQDIGGDEAL